MEDKMKLYECVIHLKKKQKNYYSKFLENIQTQIIVDITSYLNKLFF